MRTSGLQTMAALALSWLIAGAAGAQLVGTSTDVFDSTQGTVVLSDDTIVDPINAFRTSGGFENGHTLMRNGGLGSVSFINFQTVTPVSIDGVRLLASNDLSGCCLRRAMSRFVLKADTDDNGSFETTAIDQTINPNYSLQAGNVGPTIDDLDMTLLTGAPVVAQTWRMEVTQGSNIQPFEGARVIEVDAIETPDADQDGVPDASDNCVIIENPLQENLDGDMFGDACDNCPRVVNDSQVDLDNDGYGDLCDAEPSDANEEIDVQDPTPKRPGEPVQVEAVFLNPNAFEILLVRPDCFNTSFEIRDSFNVLVPPTHSIGPPYKMALGTDDPEGDLIKLGPGETFTVSCDISEKAPPELFTSGAGGATEMYDVEATYGNDLIDPDCLPAVPGSVFVPDPDECVEIQTNTPTFVGSVTSDSATVEIAGDPILVEDTVDATCVANPSTWFPEWVAVNGPNVTMTLSGIPAVDVDLTTIRLNGVTVPETTSVLGADVKAVFERSEAVRALGSLVPGTTVFPRVTGAFNTGAAAEFFRSECPVQIQAAIAVEVDIKPGNDDNVIKLGSNGNIPVAILSSAEFDATTVVPGSVALANAGLKLKGNGSGIYSIDDVNNDGLDDMLVHILTRGLELTASSESAELVGHDTSGTPIFGVDSVQVKE